MDRAQAGRDVDPGGPAIPRPDEPLDIGHPHVGHVHRRRPADLERALRAAGHGAAHPDLAPVRRGPAMVGACRRCPAALERGAVRGGRARRARRASAGSPRCWTTVDLEPARRRPPGRPRLPPARGPGRVPRPRARRPGGRATRTARRRRPAGPGRRPRPGAPPGAHRRGRSARRRCSAPSPLWVPGTAAEAMRGLLDAGLRIDGFPGMICWSRAEHPFDRYLPDLAGHRLRVCRARHASVSLRRTWPHRPCPWAEASLRPAPRAATTPDVRLPPRPLRHRAQP